MAEEEEDVRHGKARDDDKEGGAEKSRDIVERYNRNAKVVDGDGPITGSGKVRQPG